MARLGQETQKIVYGTLAELITVDFGPALHCLALCGDTHPLELELLEHFKVKLCDIGSATPSVFGITDFNDSESDADSQA